MSQPYPTWALRSVLGLLLALIVTMGAAQNSMIGDGFGGRIWYRPTNYTVGSYSAFSLCYSDPCDSSSNQLYGWGADGYGELGNGQGQNCSSVPVAIPGMSNVRYYSTGYWMGAIKNDGTGWVWTDPAMPSPTQVIADVKFVDASANYTSFVKNDGTVWTIGDNSIGQFGNGNSISDFNAPVQMSGVNNAVRVACGLYSNSILLADSTVMVVGSSQSGLLANPAITDNFITLPVVVTGLDQIVDIKAHTRATAALDKYGNVYCWGNGDNTGDTDFLNDTVPKRIEALSDIVGISGCTDGVHFLALDAYGSCYAWGFVNGMNMVQTPVLVATDVIDIMAGETFSYVVKSDGTLWAAGYSNGCSIWLDQSNTPRTAFTQLDPSAVAGSCPVVGTVAIATATCSVGSITVYHFGGQAPYQYDIGNGPQSSNLFTDVPLGSYTVTVTDANGCVITVPCTIDAYGSTPVLVDMGTVYACRSEGYTLPSGTTVYPPGTYSDTTFSALGCDTVRLFEVLPMWVNWQLDLCEGEPFTLPNGDVVYAPGYHVVNAMLDTLLYPSQCDTTNSITLVLSNLPPIVASIGALDTVLALGESVDLSGVWGSSYSWSPSTTLSCSTCPNPTATPTATTEYCVVVEGGGASGIGCGLDTACITITVWAPPAPTCTTESIFVPSAFSPDANGKNDMQCVHGGECIRSMTFAIYDRWGNKVFESIDPKACWDGTHKGQPLDPAVFVYHLSATTLNRDKVERQGNITLVR